MSKSSKLCTRCKIEKARSEFSFRSGKASKYLQSWCKECTNVYSTARIKSFTDEKHLSLKKYMSDYSAKYNSSVHGKTINLYNKAKLRAKQKKLVFNLSKELIRKKIENGKCERTGIPFQMENSGVTLRNYYSPSIDRINPLGNYTDENVQITCDKYNMAKGEMTDFEFFEFCRIVVKFNSVRKEKDDEF